MTAERGGKTIRLRCKKGSYEYIDGSDYCVHDPFGHVGKWNGVFGNGNPIRLEIGSGRGSFVTQCAARYPEANFVAVELYASPMYRAIRKAEETECPNLKFLRMDAEFLPKVFAEGEISVIYLNFSDPWPKNSKFNKRLTSAHFLGKYRQFLAKDGRIEFKTDNESLFRFSLNEAKNNGWDCTEITDNLHENGNPEWNVMTDYESAFVAEGIPIHRAVFSGDGRSGSLETAENPLSDGFESVLESLFEMP